MAGNQGINLKGAKVPGSGRVPGTRNYKTELMDELMSDSYWGQKLEAGEVLTPALFWIEILNDVTKDFDVRNDCAKSLAPYLYKKQPVITETKISTEQNNLDGFTISVIPKKVD